MLFCLNVIFYNLRHEAISRIFEKGLNVLEVASITGIRRLVSCLGMCRLILVNELNIFVPKNKGIYRFVFAVSHFYYFV